ncbi:fibronectin type III domain-containing protein [Butyrivibrio sp. VCD2006]|uniref:fibronectin type III domain-containing protein n=1 Tax=Butyrivibrio sp. VCD2006 TaxID=1280664 RepID=UPI00047C61D0|nr:hypothetical protein [Butyrivibrio sp. VCD2006]
MREKFFRGSGLMLGIVAFMALIAFHGIDAKAEIKQTKATDNSITITWNDKTKAGYYLGYSDLEDSAQATEAARTMALSKMKSLRYAKKYTFSKITPGTRYVVAIAFKDSTGKFDTTTAEVRTLPQAVTGLNQEKWYRELKSCRVRWDKQAAAQGYDYKFMDMKGNVIEQGSTTDTSFVGKVVNNKIYTASVKAYNVIGGVRYDSVWSEPAYLITQPARKKSQFVNFDLNAKVSGGKMKISWEKVKGLDGYKVYVATKKNGSFVEAAKVKGSKNSCTIKKIGNKKLKKGKTYYVYVQGYKVAGGKTYTSGLNYITAVKGSKHTPLWVGVDWKM